MADLLSPVSTGATQLAVGQQAAALAQARKELSKLQLRMRVTSKDLRTSLRQVTAQGITIRGDETLACTWQCWCLLSPLHDNETCRGARLVVSVRLSILVAAIWFAGAGGNIKAGAMLANTSSLHLQVQEENTKQAETLIALAAGAEQHSVQMRDVEALLEAMQGKWQAQLSHPLQTRAPGADAQAGAMSTDLICSSLLCCLQPPIRRTSRARLTWHVCWPRSGVLQAVCPAAASAAAHQAATSTGSAAATAAAAVGTSATRGAQEWISAPQASSRQRLVGRAAEVHGRIGRQQRGAAGALGVP